MLKSTLRSLASYKLRLALSALAIVLGVAFVTGTFVFTDSLRKAFDDLTTAGQPDLTISASTTVEGPFPGAAPALTIPDSVVADVSESPSVAAATGYVRVFNVTVLDADGKPLGGNAGPGSVGSAESWLPPGQWDRWNLVAGEPPATPDEVVINTGTAEDLQAQVGDTLTVLLPDGSRVQTTIVGIAEQTLATFGGSGSVVMWDLPQAQKLLTGEGKITEVFATAVPGVSQNQLQQDVGFDLPPDLTTETGDQAASELSQQLDESLGFLNTFLLVFGLVSLFVSAFLIYNTFSILVAQRTRELALTRAIGATKSQVRTSVLIEALIVAVIATTAGLALGAGVAWGLRALFRLLGAPLPGDSLVLLPRTLLIAYAVGIIITVVSALIPARRAASVPPVAAMRTDLSPSSKPLRTRGLVGAALAAVAVVAMIAAVAVDSTNGSRALSILGLSALAALFAALTLAPVAAQYFIPVLAAPFRRSVVGRLAGENARRNPRRTAATAGALMVGLFLITALSIVASSTIKSTDAVVDEVISSDYVLFSSSFQGFPPAVYDAVADVDGVAIATPVASAFAIVPGGDSDGTVVTIVDPEQIGEVLNIETIEGSLGALNTPGTVIVDTETAAEGGLTVGSKAVLTTVSGPIFADVVGLYEPAGFFQGFVTGFATGPQLAAPDQLSAVYIKLADDVDRDTVRADLESALEPYPIVSLQDQTEFKDQIRSQINQLLTFIIALLVLAVLIAFLGIVNTLALSVFERTREIGLMRAVGTTQKQVRRMILIESVLIAVLGSALGLLLGVIYGIALQRLLANDGITKLGISFGQLLLFLVISAVGGVLAALWPARRASKLNVLKAIATD
jgi:putative ABC transport system permease protein